MISTDYFTNISIIQIGCGGTGSWLVPLVSKLARNIQLRLTYNQSISYSIIDNDIVEDRNILRQNFTNWDIGKNKAQALVNRACYEFPDITAIGKRINKIPDLISDYWKSLIQHGRSLSILLGCADNNKTRQLIYSFGKKITKQNNNISAIYIDGGNLLHNGQIVTSVFNFPEERQELMKKRKKSKIKFKEMFPLEDPQEEQQSCLFFGDQSQAINIMSATLMFINLQKILVASELPPELITFNSSGYSTFEV